MDGKKLQTEKRSKDKWECKKIRSKKKYEKNKWRQKKNNYRKNSWKIKGKRRGYRTNGAEIVIRKTRKYKEMVTE